jgi:hypothetical protein
MSSQMLVRVSESLHNRVNDLSVSNSEAAERALKLFMSNARASEAVEEAALLEKRAEWHDEEAERLRERAREHEQEADDARREAEQLRAEAESVSNVDADESDVEQYVDDITELLRDNPGSVVWPSHGLVEDAVVATGLSAEEVLDRVENRGVDSGRIRDSALDGGDL